MTDTPDVSRPLPAAGEKPLSSRIVRASAVILAAHLVAKLLGIVQMRVVGTLCDAVTRDLFIVAFDAVVGMFYLIGEEGLGPALLPVFMEEKNKRGEKSAWRFAGAVMTWQTLFIVLAMAAVFCFPAFFVNLLTDWGSPDKDPRYMAEGPLFVRWMIFGLFGMGLGSSTYMLLNGYKRFFLAAFGDAMLKIGFIGAVAGGALWLGADADGQWRLAGASAAYVFGAGMALGGLLKLGIHLYGLRREARAWRPSLGLSSPAFRRFLWLILPLLAGIVFAKFRDVFNQTYVLSVVKAEGLVSANAWGRKIFQAIGNIAPYAVSIAMLPFFCEMVDRGRKDELGRTITQSARLILLACAPVAALVIALSLPITRILYQGGAFTLEDCRLASTANVCYTLVLPFYAVEFIFMQAYFSSRRMFAVTAIGIAFSSLSMAGAYTGVVVLGATGAAALAAVALSFTVSRALKVFTLAGVMKRFVPCFPWRETASFLARTALVAVGGGLAAYGARLGVERLLPAGDDVRGRQLLMRVGAALAAGGAAGALATLALAWTLTRADMLLFIEWTKEKIRRRRDRKRPAEPSLPPEGGDTKGGCR